MDNTCFLFSNAKGILEKPYIKIAYNPIATTSTNATSGTTLPVKRLSSAKMQARRDKGLCYYCDKVFVLVISVRRNNYIC